MKVATCSGWECGGPAQGKRPTDELRAALALVVQLDAGSLKPDLREVSVQVCIERIESVFAPISLDKGFAVAGHAVR